MAKENRSQTMQNRKRVYEHAVPGDEDLGPLTLLPGTWKNEPGLEGRGWNLIALPFATPPSGGFNYRLLMNQYNEELVFSLVDKGVPNRGIKRNGATTQADQLIVTWTTSSPSRKSRRPIFLQVARRVTRASPSIMSRACGYTC